MYFIHAIKAEFAASSLQSSLFSVT